MSETQGPNRSNEPNSFYPPPSPPNTSDLATSRRFLWWLVPLLACGSLFVLLLVVGVVAALLDTGERSDDSSSTPSTSVAEASTTEPTTTEPPTTAPESQPELPSTSTSPAPDEAPVEQAFAEALASGASCRELFDIRNREDPSSPAVLRMNDDLIRVGCATPDPERTDLGNEPDQFVLTQRRLGWDVCSHNPEEVYAEAGTRDPAVAAEWYGEGLEEPQRTPSVEGCYRALTGQPRP